VNNVVKDDRGEDAWKWEWRVKKGGGMNEGAEG
jgi:hypothetical protein